MAPSQRGSSPESSFFWLRPTPTNDLIRLGSANDGGYVVPKGALIESKTLLTFGICDDWNFEKDFRALNPGAAIEAYDHSVSAVFFFRNVLIELLRAAVMRGSIRSLKRSWRAYRAWPKARYLFRHHRLRVVGWNAGPGDAPIDRIMNLRHEQLPVFMKMDIEGSEYDVLTALLNTDGAMPNVMVVEFHDTANRRDEFTRIVKHASENFFIVHIHANNFGGVASDGLPEVLEITFINRSSQSFGSFVNKAEGLDAPCNPEKAELQLPRL